jgi:AcrR family transcriptional regulator
MASTIPKTAGSARERLLAAANELFYAEGVHTVGIDRVIERAGVAKASLYSTFGSKEELVRVYLQGRAQSRYDRITQRIALQDNPRDRILCVFDVLAESAAEPTFRGCALVNASAEGALGEGRIHQVCVDSRAWTRQLFTDLAREHGVVDPEQMAARLVLLYDGAVVGASVDRHRAAPSEAREAAAQLLAAEPGHPPTSARTRARANSKSKR